MALSDKELADRAAGPEDNLTERKLESVAPRDIRKTVVGFANSVPPDQTAVLFIGISDDGRIVGVVDVAPAYQIELIEKKLGDPRRFPGHHASALGYVLDCNRHYVVLRDSLSGTVFFRAAGVRFAWVESLARDH